MCRFGTKIGSAILLVLLEVTIFLVPFYEPGTKRQLMVSAVVTVLLARITVLLLSDISGLASKLRLGLQSKINLG